MPKPLPWLLAWGLLASLPVAAQNASPPAADAPSPQALKQLNEMQRVLDEPEVAWKHPDLRYRNLGIEAYKDGDKPRALRMLIEASRYGDKPSQAMVASMYWNGDGTAVDRPRAYAWMDLAADRGYRDLILQREAYWSRLSEAERAQALSVGQGVYAEYSDEQGRQRLALQLSRYAANVTGSHAGYVGNGFSTRSFASLMSMDAGAGGYVDADLNTYQLSQYYNRNVWRTDDYLRMKDQQWRLQGPLHGHVEVGGPQQVEPPPAQPPS